LSLAFNFTDTIFDEQDAPRPLASIEEFFAATGTEFVNDIIGMTGGFDLSSSKARRKSLAASAFGDESKGELQSPDECEGSATHLKFVVTDRTPPTFADLVVAGACHSVMYELYRNVSLVPLRSNQPNC